MRRVSQHDAARLISSAIDGKYGLSTNILDGKSGEVRVYIGNFGYVLITNKISVDEVRFGKKEITEWIGDLMNCEVYRSN